MPFCVSESNEILFNEAYILAYTSNLAMPIFKNLAKSIKGIYRTAEFGTSSYDNEDSDSISKDTKHLISKFIGENADDKGNLKEDGQKESATAYVFLQSFHSDHFFEKVLEDDEAIFVKADCIVALSKTLFVIECKKKKTPIPQSIQLIGPGKVILKSNHTERPKVDVVEQESGLSSVMRVIIVIGLIALVAISLLRYALYMQSFTLNN